MLFIVRDRASGFYRGTCKTLEEAKRLAIKSAEDKVGTYYDVYQLYPIGAAITSPPTFFAVQELKEEMP